MKHINLKLNEVSLLFDVLMNNLKFDIQKNLVVF